MAKLRISGVWINEGIITHYAIHTQALTGGYNRAIKTTKAEAIRQVSNTANETMTWLWDYQNAKWKDGEKVTVVNGSYLRSNPDNKLTDNLGHLINYNWLS